MIAVDRLAPHCTESLGGHPFSFPKKLPDSVTETDIAEGLQMNYANLAIEPPDDVDINEILFRPTRQEF